MVSITDYYIRDTIYSTKVTPNDQSTSTTLPSSYPTGTCSYTYTTSNDSIFGQCTVDSYEEDQYVYSGTYIEPESDSDDIPQPNIHESIRNLKDLPIVKKPHIEILVMSKCIDRQRSLFAKTMLPTHIRDNKNKRKEFFNRNRVVRVYRKG